MKVQEGLFLAVWCRWALGQRRKWLVRMQEPKGHKSGNGLVKAEMGWGSAFGHCTNAKKQSAFCIPGKRHFSAKAEAFLCYKLNYHWIKT